MSTSRNAQRRLAGLTSLKALVSAGSIAAVLAGCGVISTINQPASDNAAQPAATEQPDQSTTQPGPAAGLNVEGGRLRPGHGQFSPPPAFGSGSGQQPGSQFTLPRTRSSQ